MKFNDCKAGLKKMNTDNSAMQYLWVSIQKTTVDIRIESNKNSPLVFKRTTISLMFAWACSTHKAQE